MQMHLRIAAGPSSGPEEDEPRAPPQPLPGRGACEAGAPPGSAQAGRVRAVTPRAKGEAGARLARGRDAEGEGRSLVAALSAPRVRAPPSPGQPRAPRRADPPRRLRAQTCGSSLGACGPGLRGRGLGASVFCGELKLLPRTVRDGHRV
ncbi:hypothetical protein NN561_006046 [Cricetulus griseus]